MMRPTTSIATSAVMTAFVILVLACPAAGAEMKITVGLFYDNEPAGTLVIPVLFEDKEIAEYVGNPTNGVVQVDGYVPEHAMLSLRTGANALIPIYPITLSAGFSELTQIAFYYFDDTYFKATMDRAFLSSSVVPECGNFVPTESIAVQTVFMKLYYCREAVMLWEERGYDWQYGYAEAIKGWFEAVNFLYTSAVRVEVNGEAVNVSPYGVDEELLARLVSIDSELRSGSLTLEEIAPLDIDRLRELLTRFAEEDVRFGGFLPSLRTLAGAEQGEALAAFVAARFDDIAAATGAQEVAGLSRHQVRDDYVTFVQLGLLRDAVAANNGGVVPEYLANADPFIFGDTVAAAAANIDALMGLETIDALLGLDAVLTNLENMLGF